MGAVFMLRTSGADSVLCSFDEVDGEQPDAGLTHYAGMFYGTAAGGGSRPAGTVFAIR